MRAFPKSNRSSCRQSLFCQLCSGVIHRLQFTLDVLGRLSQTLRRLLQLEPQEVPHFWRDYLALVLVVDHSFEHVFGFDERPEEIYFHGWSEVLRHAIMTFQTANSSSVTSTESGLVGSAVFSQ